MNIVKGQGLPDFVMLDKVNEEEFISNLSIRFDQKQIYTYIGEQVVAMNPFQPMGQLYSKSVMEDYRNKYLYEVQPHIYALADDTYRALNHSKKDQCVIITGESGAGKTEASKIFMQYIACVTSKAGRAAEVNEKLLSSNPLLEAFGNAKTIRNDNSSRFGKYMEIQFDGAGSPQGGKISQYLLEKSRVVTRAKDERSFHIFYQLLSDGSICQQLKLKQDPAAYNYFKLSGCYKIDRVSDAEDFFAVTKAMGDLGISDADKKNVWKVLAAIIHLGNVDFALSDEKKNTDASRILNEDVVKTVAELLELDPKVLGPALVSRSISTGAGGKESNINVLLDVKQAQFCRDSLAKTLYDKVFTWVVDKVNISIVTKAKPEVVVGVLDIYGFEIFEINSFEQFCINYCNEKLQQLFIQLVLKQEQEEYQREGIEWTKIDYFDNGKIVDLVEGPSGVFKLLDEACMVGQATPKDLLVKLDQSLGKHEHYKSFASAKDKTISSDAFRIRHYAGDVDYHVEEFLFKNLDTLFNSLVTSLQSSRNSLVQSFYPVSKVVSKARPVTAGTQFKTNVNALIENLSKCQPHYIRCIKSNDQKKAFNMNVERVKHQVRYLNLTETVRVRKAGFANRQHYSRFLARYKMISPKTWPIWRGTDQAGVKEILDALGIKPQEYRLGKTKLFVKDAKTLMLIEEKRMVMLPIVAQKIQALYRGWHTRKWIKKHKDKLLLMKSAGRIQMAYIHYMVRKWIKNLIATFKDAKNMPNFGRNLKFPPLTSTLKVADSYLKKLLKYWWAYMKIISLTPAEQGRMRQKVAGMSIFSGRKPWDCSRPWSADYLDIDSNQHRAEYVKAVQQMYAAFGDTQILFADNVEKLNPKGKLQERALFVSDKNIYKYDPKKYKMKKTGIPLANVDSIRLSSKPDSFVVLVMQAPIRDLAVDLGHQDLEKYSEFVTVVYQQVHRLRGTAPPVVFEDKIVFNNNRDEEGKKKGQDNALSFSPAPGNQPRRSVLQKADQGYTVLYRK